MASISEIVNIFGIIVIIAQFFIVIYFTRTTAVYRNGLWILLSDFLSGVLAITITICLIYFLFIRIGAKCAPKFIDLMVLNVLIVCVLVTWTLYVILRDRSTPNIPIPTSLLDKWNMLNAQPTIPTRPKVKLSDVLSQPFKLKEVDQKGMPITPLEKQVQMQM